jgi:hypothetical protein
MEYCNSRQNPVSCHVTQPLKTANLTSSHSLSLTYRAMDMTPRHLRVNGGNIPSPPTTPEKLLPATTAPVTHRPPKRRPQQLTLEIAKRRALNTESRGTAGKGVDEREEKKTAEASLILSAALQRFARHGGPDLSDLRGVRASFS